MRIKRKKVYPSGFSGQSQLAHFFYNSAVFLTNFESSSCWSKDIFSSNLCRFYLGKFVFYEYGIFSDPQSFVSNSLLMRDHMFQGFSEE